MQPILCFALFFLFAANPLVVPTENGPVRGTFSSPAVKVWRGIPFAAPPVGDLRFASPTAPSPWGPSVLDCTVDRRSICPQLTSVFGVVLGSEDCLYMDVYSPANSSPNSKLPVMVWFYGGAYIFGDKHEFGLYDATNLVGTQNYVHVAMNYRLSALGFLSLPGLQDENSNKSTGNYGLQDQQFVLQWVQRNIQNFGGDPNKVTIFGESAGAFSVCWHLVSPSSKGLFHAAIMESGNCENPGFFYPVKKAIDFGKYYADVVGCNSSLLNDKELVECLRALPASQVLNGGVGLESMALDPRTTDSSSDWKPLLFPLMPWGPSIDGSPAGLVDLPWNIIQSGQFNKVPLIIGTNANEGNIFIPGIPFITGASFPLNQAGFKKAIDHFFNDSTTDKITDLYQSSASTWEGVASLVLRDMFFGCPARRYARSWFKFNVPVFLYHFTFVAPNWIDQWALGDYHSSELEFVYDNPWPPLIHYFDAADKQMAATFGGYWSNLAYTGSPNTGPTQGLLQWPQYNPNKEAVMDMTVPNTVDSQYLDNICDFWDTVVYLS